MYAKGKPQIVPSDSQSKEKWDKPIPIGEPPGFLHSWWSVFWDLYSAAPERRDTHDHSNEAKGFVNSGFPNGMPHPNHPGMPQGSGPMGPPNSMDPNQPMLRGQPPNSQPGGNQPPRGMVFSPMHPHNPGMRFPPGMHPGMRPGPPCPPGQRWPPVVVCGSGQPGGQGGHPLAGQMPPGQVPPPGHPGIPPQHPPNPQNMPNSVPQANQNIAPSPGHPVTPGSCGNQPGSHPMMLPPSPNNPDFPHQQQQPPHPSNHLNSNTPPNHSNISGSPYGNSRPSPHLDGFNNNLNNPPSNNGGNNGQNPNPEMMNGRMMPPPGEYMEGLKASPLLPNSSVGEQQNSSNEFINGQGNNGGPPTTSQMDSSNYNPQTSNSQSINNSVTTSQSLNGVPSVQFPIETERAAKNQLIEEGRRIRLKELEKIRQQDEDSDTSSRNNVYSRYSSRNSSIEPTSNLSNGSRSLDSRELKLQLIALEEKYKEVMVANAQIDSEKQLLRYELDLLKDKLEDYTDSNQALKKCSSERKRQIAYQNMQIREYKHRISYVQAQIEARDKLLTDYNLLFYGSNGMQDAEDVEDDIPDANESSKDNDQDQKEKQISIPGLALVSKETAECLNKLSGENLEEKINLMIIKNEELNEKLESLETKLEEQKEKINIAQRYDSNKSRINGLDSDEYKQIQNAKAQAQDYKFKYQEALQRISAKEGDIIRLEAQVKRYKAIAETCEIQENDLKQDRRKLQRDLRERNSQIEDLKSENSTLTRKLEKLSKSAGISIPGINVVAGSSNNSSFPRSFRESSNLPVNVRKYVEEKAALCEPDDIFICDGSEEENNRLLDLCLKEGIIRKLDAYKNNYLCLTDPADVARVESKTMISTPNKYDTVPHTKDGLKCSLGNWVSPEELERMLSERFPGCMRGRTMYVIPFSMGPVGGPISKIGIELTDSPYVTISMRIMTRVGKRIMDLLKKDDSNFIKALHSVGLPKPETRPVINNWPCNPEKTIITHYPHKYEINSFGSGYGGNSLLGKKCFALRIGSYLGQKEGWLAEHMLILGIKPPNGPQRYIAAAFPSACGKTNLAMLKPTLPGYEITCVGDDIAWMKFDEDGRLRAINPENGFFGVAPGTSDKTNPNIMQCLKENCLFTNVASTDSGEVYWEGLEKFTNFDKVKITDWHNQPWTKDSGKNAAHPNSRFTAPASQCPIIDPQWEDPRGVPIDAIIFGGRRSTGIPLVLESFDWQHGVFMGASMKSQSTAAAEHKSNQLMHDPFAMRPFFGYNFGKYLDHWLSFEKKANLKLPKIYHVNWFLCDNNNKFIWPGFGENCRVLDWICKRLDGQVACDQTVLGYIPRKCDLNTSGLNVDYEALFNITKQFVIDECDELEQYFDEQVGCDTPTVIHEQLKKLRERANKL